MNQPQLPLDKKDLTAIKEFHKIISKKLGNNLLRVAIFGSKITGKATPESDIDLFVLVNRSDARLRNGVLDVAYEINLKHMVYISPRVIDRETFNNPVWSATPFLRGLKQQSVSL